MITEEGKRDVCAHCNTTIELKRLDNPNAVQTWWSHVGGSAYCPPTTATPKPQLSLKGVA